MRLKDASKKGQPLEGLSRSKDGKKPHSQEGGDLKRKSYQNMTVSLKRKTLSKKSIRRFKIRIQPKLIKPWLLSQQEMLDEKLKSFSDLKDASTKDQPLEGSKVKRWFKKTHSQEGEDLKSQNQNTENLNRRESKQDFESNHIKSYQLQHQLLLQSEVFLKLLKKFLSTILLYDLKDASKKGLPHEGFTWSNDGEKEPYPLKDKTVKSHILNYPTSLRLVQKMAYGPSSKKRSDQSKLIQKMAHGPTSKKRMDYRTISSVAMLSWH